MSLWFIIFPIGDEFGGSGSYLKRSKCFNLKDTVPFLDWAPMVREESGLRLILPRRGFFNEIDKNCGCNLFSRGSNLTGDKRVKRRRIEGAGVT